MSKLEAYLDKTTKISNSIYEKYKEFDYDSENDFKTVVDFLVEHIYNYKTTKDQNARPNQKKFRKLIEKRDKTCIVTNSISDECSASHIVDVQDDGDYDINNGFLLEQGLHHTFDKHMWCINPETLKIEINKSHNKDGTIWKYNNKIVNIDITPQMKINLIKRYQMFCNKN